MQPSLSKSNLVLRAVGAPLCNIPHHKTLEDVTEAIKEAGLDYSNLIFGKLTRKGSRNAFVSCVDVHTDQL